jgi:hypothetical protein
MTPKQLILQELTNSGRDKSPLQFQHGMNIPIGRVQELWNTPSNGAIDSATLGYQYTIQTTTLIRAEVVEQKFYEIPFAQYMPVIPGEAAWMETIKTNLVYKLGGTFEQGIVNTGSNEQVFTKVNVGTAPVTQTVALWAKAYDYSVFEVNKALALNNWDVVRGKMEALKTDWDLGLQQLSFLGMLSDNTNFPGLLSQANVNINLSVITKNISTFANSGGDMNTFVSAVLAAYFANSNNTTFRPDHFAMPIDDYLGLAQFVNPAFPLAGSMMIDVLENAFKKITGNTAFVIYGVLYAKMSVNAGVWTTNGTQRYILYRKDPKSVRMDLPQDFVLAAPVPVGPVTFEGLGYGQFTGVVAFRPAEMLYFDHT